MTRDPGDNADRHRDADRARTRATEAGERAAALRVRIAELKAATGDEVDPATAVHSAESLASAQTRRDEAAHRDRVAHDSAARAHDRAADTFEELARTGAPDRKADYLARMDRHRLAADADRVHGETPPTDSAPDAGNPPT